MFISVSVRLFDQKLTFKSLRSIQIRSTTGHRSSSITTLQSVYYGACCAARALKQNNSHGTQLPLVHVLRYNTLSVRRGSSLPATPSCSLSRPVMENTQLRYIFLIQTHLHLKLSYYLKLI